MINQVVLSGHITKLTPRDTIGSFSLKSVHTYNTKDGQKESFFYTDVSCVNAVFKTLQPDQEVVLVGRISSYKKADGSWGQGVFATEVYPISSNTTRGAQKAIRPDDDDTDEADVPF